MVHPLDVTATLDNSLPFSLPPAACILFSLNEHRCKLLGCVTHCLKMPLCAGQQACLAKREKQLMALRPCTLAALVLAAFGAANAGGTPARCCVVLPQVWWGGCRLGHAPRWCLFRLSVGLVPMAQALLGVVARRA